MSNRLFRYAEIVANKYKIILAEDKPVPNPKDIRAAKSDLVTTYNLYINPNMSPIQNPYSLITGGALGHNKYQSLAKLATFPTPDKNAKTIMKIMMEMFDSAKISIDKKDPLGHMSLTKIVNRVNLVLQLLSDENIANMVALIKATYPSDKDHIQMINGLKMTVKSLKGNLLKISKALSSFASSELSENVKEYERPVTPMTRTELAHFIRGMSGNPPPPEVFAHIGLMNTSDLDLALNNKLGDLVEHVIRQIKTGHLYTKDGERLRKAIEALKLQQAENVPNIVELEQSGIPEGKANPASLFDPGTGPKADIPFTVSRRQTPEEELADAKFMKEQLARERGGGVGEGSL
jgi:hypothetical protein